MAGWRTRFTARLKAALRDPWFHVGNLAILGLVGLLWWNSGRTQIEDGPVFLVCSGADDSVLSEPAILPRAPAGYLLQVKEIQENSEAYRAQRERREELLAELPSHAEGEAMLGVFRMYSRSLEVSPTEEGTQRAFDKRAFTASNRLNLKRIMSAYTGEDAEKTKPDDKVEALLRANFEMALQDHSDLAGNARVFGIDQYLAYVMQAKGVQPAMAVAQEALAVIEGLAPEVPRKGAVLFLRLGHIYERHDQHDLATEFYEKAAHLGSESQPQISALAQLQLADLRVGSDETKAAEALTAARGLLERRNAKNTCSSEVQVALIWKMTEVMARLGQAEEAEALRETFLEQEAGRWRRRES